MPENLSAINADLKMCANISKTTIEKYREEQIKLSSKIVENSLKIKEGLIAGIDVSYSGEEIFCSIVIIRFPELKLERIYNERGKTEFPYIPGLLSFREMPIVLKTFEKIKEDVFLIFCDGHGVAHPRGFGLASHIGTVLKKPSIGVAKSRLVGEYKEPAPEKGNHTFLVYKSRIVGAVLRTKNYIKPVFVSVGNNIDLRSAIDYTLKCSIFRIPEPTRLAHKYVTEYKKMIN